MERTVADRPLVFVSYAREDKELCRRLVLMLGLVLKARGYSVWWDQVMVAGAWRDQLDAQLDRAAAGVLLVSEYALTSPFVMEEELPRLLARGPVAPVLCRPCPWESHAVVASLQFLGSTERALAELDEDLGELAAALSELARQAPDFLGLVAVAEPAAAAPNGDGGGAAQRTGDTAAASDRPADLHGVPELPAGYFERTADLDELRSQLLLAGGRAPFGIHGAGGIGKTVLATALARDPALRRAYPDGVYWAVLGERPDTVTTLGALARLVGVDPDFRTAEEGQAALREALRDRRVLMVIDDAWSAADVEALLVNGPAGRTLVTTRHPLVLDRLRAQRAPVDRLDRAEARRFLAESTGTPEPLPSEADELVEAVGGFVLALALVGATISHGTSWADALADVRAAADIYVDDSFANQFKAMQLAWDALDGDVRHRYMELAVFGEDVAIPEPTIGRLWRHSAGLDQPETERLCAQLAERSLLGFDGTVRFHDLQRAFLGLQTANSALAHRRLLAAHADVPATADRWSTLPDDEPYLWEHLVDHLIAAGDVTRLEETLVDPVWILRRYHLQGPHAPESDLERGLSVLPTYRRGTRVLHRLRQVSHLMRTVSTLSDRALTLAHHMSDLIPVDALTGLFSPVRLRPRGSRSQASEALERVIAGHVGGVWSVAWSSHGRQLASAGLDGTVRIWDTDTAGRQAAALHGHRGGVRAVAWSPDGRRLASGGDDGIVRVFDAGDWRALPVGLARHDGAVWSVAWSPDGRQLATAGGDATVRVWEPGTSDGPIAVLAGHEGSVWSVAWSPDASRLASGGADRCVRAWALDAPAEPGVVVGRHVGWAWAVAWAPDGRRLLSGGDRTVRIWDADAPGTALACLGGHDGLVWSVACSPDGRRLASGCSDRSVRVWDFASLEAQGTLAGHDDHVWSIAWSPDSRRLASAGHDETVRLWDPAAADPQPPAAAPGRWLWALAWSPDGRRLATGSEDGAVRVWDVDAPGTPAVVLADVAGGIWALAWSPDGRRLAAGGADRIIRLWDVAAWGAPALELADHRGLLRSLAWSPDGRQLASAGDDGTLRLWTADAPDHPVVIRDDDGMRARSVVWSPDGSRLASGNDDGTLRVRGASQWARPAVRTGHQGRVESVAWSPDGRRLASAGLDGTVRVWDADDLGPSARVLVRHDDPVTAVAWAPDGRRLVCGGEGGAVQLWDVTSATPVSALGLGSMVCSLACHGERIAVGMTTTWMVLNVEAAGAGAGTAVPERE